MKFYIYILTCGMDFMVWSSYMVYLRNTLFKHFVFTIYAKKG